MVEGVCWIAHVFPFQRSARVRSYRGPDVYPAAKHTPVVGHETPISDARGRWIDHLRSTTPRPRRRRRCRRWEKSTRRSTGASRRRSGHGLDRPVLSVPAFRQGFGGLAVVSVVPYSHTLCRRCRRRQRARCSRLQRGWRWLDLPCASIPALTSVARTDQCSSCREWRRCSYSQRR